MTDSLPKSEKQSFVEMFTKDYCPYCTAAANLLTQRGIAFVEVDITQNAEKREEMLKRAAPRMTVPQIFIGDLSIGGYTDLKKLDDEGKLEGLAFPKGR